MQLSKTIVIFHNALSWMIIVIFLKLKILSSSAGYHEH